MGEINLSIGDRKVAWDLPDEVAVVMLQSFVQVCGPAKSDVEVCKICSTGIWCGDGSCSQWTNYMDPNTAEVPPRHDFDSGLTDQEAATIVAGARTGAGVGTNNIVLSNQVLLDVLIAKQHELCAYATTDGDGRTCDCKYNMAPGLVAWPFGTSSEVTGCPELRSAIQVLRGLVEFNDAAV